MEDNLSWCNASEKHKTSAKYDALSSAMTWWLTVLRSKGEYKGLKVSSFGSLRASGAFDR